MNQQMAFKNTWLQLACLLLGILGFTSYALSKFANGQTIVFITAAGMLGFLGTLVALPVRTPGLARKILVFLASLLGVMVFSYAFLFGFIYFYQDRLVNETSTFFQPKAISEEAAQALLSARLEAVDLTTPDGARLRGWLVRNSTDQRSPLIIYFDGSGAEVSDKLPYFQTLTGWSALLVNYRGFGLSQGVPSQSHALADATFLYDTFARRADIDPTRVVAMGYSLGTGVAVYLSEQRPTAATILAAPYDRWTLIGLKSEPIYAPLQGILKPYFDSISRAPAIRSPLLCLVGAQDTTVPPQRSLALADRWAGGATVKTYPGEDHSLLVHASSIWTDIQAFLEGLP